MYSRQFTERPEKIIQNGKAKFGSFIGVSSRLDIKGMRTPYAGIPMPAVISNLRIKGRINYIFSLEKYIGLVHFLDFKIFTLSEVVFWNKETEKKYVYHAIIPLRRRTVPINTTKGICASYYRSRFIKTSWGQKHQNHNISFKVKGDKVRPNAEGIISSLIDDDFHSDFMFVNPAPTSSRCSATWIGSMKIHGKIKVKDDVNESDGLALLSLNRTYYKFQDSFEIAYGIGTVKEKNITFNLQSSNLDAADSNKYNNNVLIVDGVPTALPPVYITHPFGIGKDWIIQDTESMIDLTFTPVSLNNRNLDMIIMRTVYSTVYGLYNGILLDKDGNKIFLKNLPGIIYKSKIRL